MTAGAEPTWHGDNADVAPEDEREAADTVDEQEPTVPGVDTATRGYTTREQQEIDRHGRGLHEEYVSTNCPICKSEEAEPAQTLGQLLQSVSPEFASEDQDVLEQIGRGVAKQLAGGKSKAKIVKEFVKDGWSEESATVFVEEVEAQPAGTWVFYAGFWQRFGAYLLDYLIVLVVAGIPAILVALITYEAERPAVHTFFTQDQEDAAVATAEGAFAVVGLVITIVYLYIGNSFGGTLGKRAFGLRVVSASDGGNIGLERGLNRIFVYPLGSIAGVGWLWMVGDDQKQTWHDKAAGSIVVRKR